MMINRLVHWCAFLLATGVLAGCAGSPQQLAPMEDHSVKVPPVGARGSYTSSTPRTNKEESHHSRESRGGVETRPVPLPDTLQGVPLAGETLEATPLPNPPPSPTPSAIAPNIPAGSSERGRRSETLAVVPVPPATSLPIPPTGRSPEPSVDTGKRVQASSNAGVVALLEKADDQVSSGQLDQAAASLERALRIEAGNGRLWHELASIRLKQSRLDEAANLAEKSNALARGQGDLQASNWRLIAVVRKKQGQNQEADDALARARSLENGR